jgi:hypothetical protein
MTRFLEIVAPAGLSGKGETGLKGEDKVRWLDWSD